jgi:alanine racemase
MNDNRRCEAVVSLDALVKNAKAIRARLKPETMLMAVVKADAYGHGDHFVTSELKGLVDWFGVSSLDEAVSIRRHDTHTPVLVFGPTAPGYARTLGERQITQAVHSAEYGFKLAEAAKAAGVAIDVHIKVDTGMARLGFVADGESLEQSAADIVRLKRGCPALNLRGIFTHFSSADYHDADSVGYTRMQFARFTGLLEKLAALGATFETRHCCNSAGTINYPEMHLDMVRPGIILYGLSYGWGCPNFAPVMGLRSQVTMVKEIPEGTCVSYGRTYTAKQPMTIATVPIGYADGFGRELTNRAQMLVRGKTAIAVGRICMDQLMIDVTHIKGVKTGDTVTVIGKDGENAITFDDMAALSGTIGYEKVCLIGRRVPRVYVRGGEEVGVVEYINRG